MKGLSSNEIRLLILSVGTHKSTRPLSPIEVGKYVQRAINAGETRATVAETLLLDDATVIGRFVRLLSLPPQVQQLIGWGSDPATVSFTSASDIARLKSETAQIALAKAALESRLNKSEIIEIVQISERSQRPIESCIEEVLNQRPIVERRHVIIGELQSDSLNETLLHMSQSQRNDLLLSALVRYGLNTSLHGAKLGDGYFLLVGDDVFQSVITSLPGGFEESITKYLTRELSLEGSVV
ncbi:MAG: hypothetical protein OXN17_15485 [Candidatus Poribacteria bacterium]|nr:hypothetical protein [Candidatus Poribacteria bacterium]MDE0503794.1 hypothetical protein [Candidatus Poribacteria bacterium]